MPNFIPAHPLSSFPTTQGGSGESLSELVSVDCCPASSQSPLDDCDSEDCAPNQNVWSEYRARVEECDTELLLREVIK